MEVVGARRRDRVVDHAGGLAELRREAVGDDLHLADEHFGDRQHAQAGAVLLGVGVAVELVVGVHLAAVGVDARHAELVVLVAGDVGLEEREVVGIARDQRQVAGLRSRRWSGRDRSCPGCGDRRLAGDGDGSATLPTSGSTLIRAIWPADSVMPLLFELLEALQLGRDVDSVPSGSSGAR